MAFQSSNQDGIIDDKTSHQLSFMLPPVGLFGLVLLLYIDLAQYFGNWLSIFIKIAIMLLGQIYFSRLVNLMYNEKAQVRSNILLVACFNTTFSQDIIVP